MAQAKQSEGNLISQGVSFTKESWTELKKVSYPTKQETIQATFVVIVMMLLIAAYLGLLDLVFNELMQSIMA
ncbi:MAG: preprotein translocase subunit SecE [Deltaproteobacteria bacterium]|nr:preprotein translocase subunit SecE [Deltaproteobacteria bacterium]